MTMLSNGNAAPRGKSNEAASEFPLSPDSTSSIQIYVPLCYAGVGSGPCGDEAYCLTRNQPMCGGHCLVTPGSPEGQAYLRDHAVMIGPGREVARD